MSVKQAEEAWESEVKIIQQFGTQHENVMIKT